MPARSIMTVFPMLFALFIDGMGIAILFPILNDIIMNPADSILPLDTSSTMRHFYYGLTLGTFFISWFFGTAIISDLSDTVGRKKALLLCLSGSCIGYIFVALSIIFHSISLLLIGRIIDGFTIGSQPIAQAAIVDISTPENKSRNLALALVAPSLGFVIGPTIGGLMADKTLVSWFQPIIPMYFAAFISLANAIMLWLCFKETRAITGKLHLSLTRAFTIFYSAFSAPKIRYLSITLLFLVFGWSSFFSFISVYLLSQFNFSITDTGFYMGTVGIGFGLGSGFLTRLMTSRWRLPTAMILAGTITAVATIFTMTTGTIPYLYIWGVVIGAFGMVAYAVLVNLLSNQADTDSQGWIMGIVDSIAAFAFIASTLSEAAFTEAIPSLPLMIAVLCYGISMILMFRQRNTHS